VILWTTVIPPDDLRPGDRVELAARVDWLACKEACIPGGTETSLALPVESAARPDTAVARALLAAQRRVPVTAPDWEMSARYGEDHIEIRLNPVTVLGGPLPTGLFFYPDVQGVIDNAGRQRTESGGSGLILTVPRSTMVRATPERLTGVLVTGGDWAGPVALLVDVPLETTYTPE
jgi:thiol:disulfide interchange protein DsbD